MRDCHTIAMRLGERNSIQSLAEGANLVKLDQNGICCSPFDPTLKNLGIGDKQIVPGQLGALSKSVRQLTPSRPVILGKRVLDREDRKTRGPIADQIDKLTRGTPPPFRVKVIMAFRKKLRAGDIQAETNLFPSALPLHSL